MVDFSVVFYTIRGFFMIFPKHFSFKAFGRFVWFQGLPHTQAHTLFFLVLRVPFFAFSSQIHSSQGIRFGQHKLINLA